MEVHNQHRRQEREKNPGTAIPHIILFITLFIERFGIKTPGVKTPMKQRELVDDSTGMKTSFYFT